MDPFEAHADLIPQWLEAEADVGSQGLLGQLIALDPEHYGPPAQTHAAAPDQGLARGQGAAVPGKRSKAAGDQACNERKGVTRRQSKWVTNV